MRYFILVFLAFTFECLASSVSDNKSIEFVEIYAAQKDDKKAISLTVNSDSSNMIMYSNLDSKVYKLNGALEKLNSTSATKDELRAYHSLLISFKKDLDTVNDVVTDRLNDIFFWGNLFFSIFTILLAIGGFFIVSNNKKVAKESAQEWCSTNLQKEKEAFNIELVHLKDIAISECESAIAEVLTKQKEINNICEQARIAMTERKVSEEQLKEEANTVEDPVSEEDKPYTESVNNDSKKNKKLQELKKSINDD